MVHESNNGPVEESDLYDKWISSRHTSSSKREKRRFKSDRKKWGSRKEKEEKRLTRTVLARKSQQTLSARERRHIEHEKSKLPSIKARATETQDKRKSADINEYDEGEAADSWNGYLYDDWSYDSPCQSDYGWSHCQRDYGWSHCRNDGWCSCLNDGWWSPCGGYYYYMSPYQGDHEYDPIQPSRFIPLRNLRLPSVSYASAAGAPRTVFSINTDFNEDEDANSLNFSEDWPALSHSDDSDGWCSDLSEDWPALSHSEPSCDWCSDPYCMGVFYDCIPEGDIECW